MRIALVICTLIFLATSHAAAEIPATELPLYGEKPKIAEQQAADSQFIAEALTAAGTREKASSQLIDRGWDAIQKRDLSLAIRRFNQAYLLLPSDYRIYWGLGTATGLQGQTELSLKLFSKGAALDPGDFRFLSDFGFSIQQAAIASARNGQNPLPGFEHAARVFSEAIALNPRESLPHARLSVIYYYQEQCGKALKELSTARSLGGEGIDPLFEKDLKTRCPH